MRVFWPLDAPRREDSGLVVGWRNSERDIIVVTILHDIDVSVHLRVWCGFADSGVGAGRVTENQGRA